MTEQMERLVGTEEALRIASGSQRAQQAAHRARVFISEAEVVFGTAAAAPPRRPTPGWRTRVSRVATAWRTVARSLTYEFPEPRPRPKRLWYLEDSRLQRALARR